MGRAGAATRRWLRWWSEGGGAGGRHDAFFFFFRRAGGPAAAAAPTKSKEAKKATGASVKKEHPSAAPAKAASVSARAPAAVVVRPSESAEMCGHQHQSPASGSYPAPSWAHAATHSARGAQHASNDDTNIPDEVIERHAEGFLDGRVRFRLSRKQPASRKLECHFCTGVK